MNKMDFPLTAHKCECGENFYMDKGSICASNPPKYRLICKQCGRIDFMHCSDVVLFGKMPRNKSKGTYKMKYKCIKDFAIPLCDENGFNVENECFEVFAESIWTKADKSVMTGAEVRLDNSESWIEITNEFLMENFAQI